MRPKIKDTKPIFRNTEIQGPKRAHKKKDAMIIFRNKDTVTIFLPDQLIDDFSQVMFDQF